MANGILNIPIQINGGTASPNDLLERELYVRETQNGYELYVGTGETAVKILAIPYTQFVQADDNSITIGDIRFNLDNTDPDNTTTFSVDGKSIRCKRATFSNLGLSDVTIGESRFTDTIILTLGKNYGTALPLTGEDGQLFFKLS